MKHISSKPLILRLLDISEESYEMQLFNGGIKSLELKLGDDVEDIRKMTQSPKYWEWWKRQWERRNRILLNDFNYSDELMVPSQIARSNARREYNAIHDVYRLKIILNRIIINRILNSSTPEEAGIPLIEKIPPPPICEPVIAQLYQGLN